MRRESQWGSRVNLASDTRTARLLFLIMSAVVISRLEHLIEVSDLTMASKLRQEIKEHKFVITAPDVSGAELDSCIASHLCRLLSCLLKKSACGQLDQELILDISRVIFNTMPTADATSSPPLCDGSDFTLYGTVIQLLAVALYRTYNRNTIDFLLRHILSDDDQKVEMATDVWCLMCQFSEWLLFGCVKPLIEMEAMFPVPGHVRHMNLQTLLSHMIRCMRKQFDSDANILSIAYQLPVYLMTDDQWQAELSDLLKYVFNFSNSFLLKKRAKLLNLFSQIASPDEQLVKLISPIIPADISLGNKETGAITNV